MSEVADEFVGRILGERLAECPNSHTRYLTDKPFHDAVDEMRGVLVNVVDQCRQEGLYAGAVGRVVRGTVAALIDDRYLDQQELARKLARMHGPGTLPRKGTN